MHCLKEDLAKRVKGYQLPKTTLYPTGEYIMYLLTFYIIQNRVVYLAIRESKTDISKIVCLLLSPLFFSFRRVPVLLFFFFNFFFTQILSQNL